MTPHNLSIVFSPNMMRPRVDNPLTIVEEMKLCLKTVETLLLEHMNEALLAAGGRMTHRFSAVRGRGGSSADAMDPPLPPPPSVAEAAATAAADAEALSILKEDQIS
jgi:hypothetical protein